MPIKRVPLLSLLLFMPICIGLLLFSAFSANPNNIAHAAPSATVTVSNLNDSGAGSLRQAISNASAGDTIDFSTGGTITLTSELVINKSLTINGGEVITVSGNNAVRVFHVTTGNVTFDSLTIANGFSSGSGGGILTASGVAMTVTNSTLANNSAINNGGGIYNNADTMTVISSTLSGNVAVTYFGGGIYSVGGIVTVANSILTNNSANNVGAGSGGGINNASGTMTIDNSTFSDNSAYTGGGIFSSDTMIVSNSTFTNNSASNGGGIYNSAGTLSMTNSTLFGNGAQYGGGLGSTGTIVVKDSIISNNVATEDGGGIHNNFGIITVTNNTLSDNIATVNGGGIFNNSGTVTLIDSTFSGNTADNGSGIGTYFGTIMVRNSTLSGNEASSNGGGIHNSFGTLTITNSTLSSNLASSGGGISNQSGPMTVSHSTFSDNSAGSGGGISNRFDTITISNSTFSNNSGLYGGGISNSNSGTITVTNSTLSGNSATVSGGGIYNFSTMTVANSIIANSLSGDDCVGTVTSMGYNLDSDGSCALAVVGDMSTVSPLLGPLADNGGPATGSGQATMTHALLPNSPAIEAGNCSNGPATDQRGVARPQDASCDMGAFESPSLLTVNSVGAGSVTQNPMQADYDYGTVVTVTAVPDNAGWSLLWSGDLSGSTNPLTVTMDGNRVITATFSNDPPTADAGGNQTVLAAQLVTLDGTGSADADPTQTLSYGWVQTDGTAVVLSDATAVSPTFTAPASPTDLIFTLTVTDSLGLPGLPSETAVTVQLLLDVNIVGFGAVLRNPMQAEYDYGTVVTVTAVPNAGWSWGGWSGDLSSAINSQTVTMDTHKVITATFSNDAPTANAGVNQTAFVSQPATLDGTGSADADLTQTLSYGWVQTGGPAVLLSDVTAVAPTFTAPATQTVLTFSLTVTDSLGLPGLTSSVVVDVQLYTLFLPVVVK